MRTVPTSRESTDGEQAIAAARRTGEQVATNIPSGSDSKGKELGELDVGAVGGSAALLPGTERSVHGAGAGVQLNHIQGELEREGGGDGIRQLPLVCVARSLPIVTEL